jgi:hypothetical protein
MVMPRFDYLLSQLDVLQAESIHVMPRGRGRVRAARQPRRPPGPGPGRGSHRLASRPARRPDTGSNGHTRWAQRVTTRTLRCWSKAPRSRSATARAFVPRARSATLRPRATRRSYRALPKARPHGSRSTPDHRPERRGVPSGCGSRSSHLLFAGLGCRSPMLPFAEFLRPDRPADLPLIMLPGLAEHCQEHDRPLTSTPGRLPLAATARSPTRSSQTGPSR